MQRHSGENGVKDGNHHGTRDSLAKVLHPAQPKLMQHVIPLAMASVTEYLWQG